MGMKAAAKHAYGSDILEDKVVYVQGIGNVGEALVESLTNEGAKVIISDINQGRLEEIRDRYNVKIYEGNNLYAEEMDIYAPCALGATINDETLPQLKAKVIAGAANNQLADENKHGLLLQQKGIVYAPDFLINAGGIINVYAELENYGKKEIIRKTENIFNTTLEILKNAEINGVTTHQAAFDVAQARIDARRLKNNKGQLN
jgi:leucine dehydrogenase